MKLSSKVRRAGWAGLGAYALGMVRPGAEAALLAGVAIGCAQLAWRIAAPENVEPLSDAGASETGASQALTVAFHSPFAPLAGSEAAPDHSELAAIRLSGVRISSTPARSGAILTLADGSQRPFLVGYEVMAGVRLEAVAADHIVLAYDSGREVVSLDQPARTQAPLFALTTPPPVLQPRDGAPAWPGQTTAAAVSMNVTDGALLDAVSALAAGAHVEMRDGGPYGWRIGSPPPALAAGGLNAGDLVVSVNGAGPRDPAALVAAASRRPLEVVVERAGGRRLALQFMDGLPS